MRAATAIALTLLFFPTLACSAVTRARYLMGTICEISVPDSPRAEAEIDSAFAEVQRIENFLSTWREGSELSRLNRGEATRVTPELFQLLATTVWWSRATDGAFNPLIRPLIDAWRTRDQGALPDRSAIETALHSLAIENTQFADGTIAIRNGARFEEGAFGKGYAIDRMVELLRRNGVASGLINFGGQLAAFGRPRDVSIADPGHRDRGLIPITIAEQSISTSSGSERSFVVDGRRFTHLFDPRTGQALPPRGSVSVIHHSALIADILSTALYVMGPQDGLRWARQHDIDAVFITESRNITRSKDTH